PGSASFAGTGWRAPIWPVWARKTSVCGASCGRAPPPEARRQGDGCPAPAGRVRRGTGACFLVRPNTVKPRERPGGGPRGETGPARRSGGHAGQGSGQRGERGSRRGRHFAAAGGADGTAHRDGQPAGGG